MMRSRSFTFMAVGLLATPALAERSFVRHEVDGGFVGGYQVAVADINRDDKPDLIALSTDPSQLAWFRNPDWQRFNITTQTRKNIDVAPYDVDGDGDIDLGLACDFDLGKSNEGGTVAWLECPADPTTNLEWARHPIDSVPTSHRVRWADIDGNGRKELVNLPIIGRGAKAPDYEGYLDLWVYEIPKDPKGDWQLFQVDEGLELAHALRVAPWSYDGKDSLLVASFDGVDLFKADSDTIGMRKTRLCRGHIDKRPRHGASEVDFGSMKDPEGGVRIIATIEPWHGNEVVLYAPVFHTGKPWSRHVIDDTLKDGHALACADFDGDENSEIVAGGRACGLFVYRLGADGGWLRSDLDAAIAAAGIIVADIDQDGDPDIAATGTATHNVVWYENTVLKP